VGSVGERGDGWTPRSYLAGAGASSTQAMRACGEKAGENVGREIRKGVEKREDAVRVGLHKTATRSAG
jgi:hypothetical protein